MWSCACMGPRVGERGNIAQWWERMRPPPLHAHKHVIITCLRSIGGLLFGLTPTHAPPPDVSFNACPACATLTAVQKHRMQSSSPRPRDCRVSPSLGCTPRTTRRTEAGAAANSSATRCLQDLGGMAKDRVAGKETASKGNQAGTGGAACHVRVQSGHESAYKSRFIKGQTPPHVLLRSYRQVQGRSIVDAKAQLSDGGPPRHPTLHLCTNTRKGEAATGGGSRGRRRRRSKRMARVVKCGVLMW
jgi:hypothetical protein